MLTRSEPLTSSEKHQLTAYVDCWSTVYRVLVCFAVLSASFWVASIVLHPYFADLIARSPWLVKCTGALLVFAAMTALVRLEAAWIGGRALRQAVRSDLSYGYAIHTRIQISKVMLVEEREDEGPSFVFRTEDGRTLVFSGQELPELQAMGFPWKEFEIIEAANSRIFLGVKQFGETLTDVTVREPFSLDELNLVGQANGIYCEVEIGFEKFHQVAVARPSQS